MARLRVKICCIESAEEARLALHYGADAVGLVSAMPSGPGVISDSEISRIAGSVPETMETFLLTSRTRPVSIAEQFERCGTTTIQIVDWIGEKRLEELRKLSPGARIVQVVHVAGRGSVDRAIRLNGFVDAILLDSGRPGAMVRELGGTGRTHDWSISREIVERAGVPVWLAGGLNSANVVEAVDTVGSHGIDICSGVRSDGALDGAKLEEFFSATKPFRALEGIEE